ncbi:rhamnose-binding lectin-like [Ictalurus furcatus]|uniref:rhamnose-binding lectin-like n=1 Tax=Ictalurus furcatus TaxID=66913 RepID=UPI0023503F2B|nr:rhamnose-binding lectin-like [Ictalurus furcatus]
MSLDIRLILVKSSQYGRTNSKTCSTGRPPNQVSTTTCSLQSSKIGERCNGLRECEVKTNLLGNPDPCKGTYKYYNTTYDCIRGHLVAICEHCYSTLDCGNDSIHIINANYGRGNSRTCSNGLPSAQTQNTNCYTPNTLSTVAALCNGKKNCTVEASNTIFNDPCVGTAKYLTVSYICTMFVERSGLFAQQGALTPPLSHPPVEHTEKATSVLTNHIPELR